MSLLDPILQAVLERHMLPHMDLVDLGRLAATCRALRRLVAAASALFWRAAASRALPARHPALLSDSTAAIHEALRQQAVVHRNIRAGSCGKSPHIRAATQPVLSPCGNRVALLCLRPSPLVPGVSTCCLNIRSATCVGQGLLIDVQLEADSSIAASQVELLWTESGSRITVMRFQRNRLMIKVFDTHSGARLEQSSLELPDVWCFGGSMSPNGASFVRYDGSNFFTCEFFTPAVWFALSSTGLHQRGRLLMPKGPWTHLWHPTEEGVLATVLELKPNYVATLCILKLNTEHERDFDFPEREEMQTEVLTDAKVETDAEGLCCAWSPDGTCLAFGTLFHGIQVVGRADGRLQWSTIHCSMPERSALAFSGRGHLAHTEGATLRVYDLHTSQVLSSCSIEEDATCFSFSPDGQFLFVNNLRACRSALSIIDTDTWQPIPNLGIFSDAIKCQAWSNTGTHLVCGTGSADDFSACEVFAVYLLQ